MNAMENVQKSTKIDEAKLDHVWQNPIYFLAFGFGTGLMPKAPGTWGTLAGVLVYVLMANLSPPIYCAWVLVAFLGGIFISQRVSRDLGVDDYPGIVWDEVVGYLITMAYVPFNLFWMILGFLLFRLFDIWKPQPIRLIDKHVKGGLGVMLDDVLAAIPAWLILHLIIWI